MTTTTDPSALRIARAATARLTVQQKAQLISELAQEIASATPGVLATEGVASSAHSDPATLLARVRERLAASPANRTLVEQLEADRHGRDLALRSGENARVHD